MEAGPADTTQQADQFLDVSVRAGLNILVAGGTQAGVKQVLC
jgi:Flp pilus assembly CpaF family ATPase